MRRAFSTLPVQEKEKKKRRLCQLINERGKEALGTARPKDLKKRKKPKGASPFFGRKKKRKKGRGSGERSLTTQCMQKEEKGEVA